MSNFSQLSLHKRIGRICIVLEAEMVGNDLLIRIGGGEKHIGAIALAEPDSECMSLDVPGHRERELACEIAEMFASGLFRRVAVIAGIHYDNITCSEIDAALHLARQLAREGLQILQKELTT